MVKDIDITDIDNPKETLPDVKPDLKSVRESKGYSLRDINEYSRIGTIYLEAIENEDFHMLPPAVYAKSFIKSYAQFLGVDSQIILHRYEKYLDSLKIPPTKEQIKKPILTNKMIYAIIGAILLIIIAIFFLIALNVSSRKSDDAETSKIPMLESQQPVSQIENADLAGLKSQSPEMAANNTEVTAAVKEGGIQAGAAVTSFNKGETAAKLSSDRKASGGEINRERREMIPNSLSLTMEAKELTWIRILEDHQSTYEILLKPGDKIERAAKKSFVIDVGNASGVDVVFQGKSLGNLGKHGEVVHLNLP